MTDADKIRIYDSISELITDRVALEMHLRQEGMTGWTVEQVRIEVFESVVELVLGKSTLNAVRAAATGGANQDLKESRLFP